MKFHKLVLVFIASCASQVEETAPPAVDPAADQTCGANLTYTSGVAQTCKFNGVAASSITVTGSGCEDFDSIACTYEQRCDFKQAGDTTQPSCYSMEPACKSPANPTPSTGYAILRLSNGSRMCTSPIDVDEVARYCAIYLPAEVRDEMTTACTGQSTTTAQTVSCCLLGPAAVGSGGSLE